MFSWKILPRISANSTSSTILIPLNTPTSEKESLQFFFGKYAELKDYLPTVCLVVIKIFRRIKSHSPHGSSWRRLKKSCMTHYLHNQIIKSCQICIFYDQMLVGCGIYKFHGFCLLVFCFGCFFKPTQKLISV